MSWREPLTIPLLLGAVLLPGALLASLWGKRMRDDPLEYLFAGLAFGVLIFGWLALALAEVGCFSLARLGALWVGSTLILGALRWRRAGRDPGTTATNDARRFNRWEAGALILWAAVASWLFFRPHEFVVGGADAGVYVSLGASIADTGGILIRDPLLAELDPALYGALLRPLPPGEVTPFYLFPGFYVPGTPDGLIIPQFYPLHPVWQAVAYGAGGLRAELLITPLWGLLGALAVYFTVRRLWGWRAGLLALAALSVTALQVWFARYPTTEMLTQYLLWTGAWALVAWIDKEEPRGFWAALAGGALGQVFLARIDAYVLLLAPLVAGFWLRHTGGWRRQDGWFFGLIALLAGHSLLHGALLSRPYFYTLSAHGFRLVTRSPVLVIGVIGLGAAAWGLARLRPRTFRRLWGWIAARRQLWLAVAAALVAVAAAYGYLLRPYLGEVKTAAYWYGGGSIPNLDHENLRRLGWYLGPLGIALSVAGAGWMLLRDANRRTVFLLGTGLFFSFLYLWRIQANPHQIYTMRRYVPAVLPFFIMAAAYLIDRLYTHLQGEKRWLIAAIPNRRGVEAPRSAPEPAARPVQNDGASGKAPSPPCPPLPPCGRGAKHHTHGSPPAGALGIVGLIAVGLTAVWLSGIVFGARGFVSQVDYRGLIAQLERLDADLPAHSVIIFGDASPIGVGDMLGTPLRFLYRHDILSLRDPRALDPERFAEAIAGWRAAGRRVYWADVPGGPMWPLDAAALGPPVTYHLETMILENVYDHKPTARVPAVWHFSLAEVRDER